MALKVAINGFGRIGRLCLRGLLQRHPSVEVAAINDLATPEQLAYLFKYDSTYGKWPGEVTVAGSALEIDGRRITVVSEADPAKLPWRDLGVGVVLECTGRLTDGQKAAAHLAAGAAKVIISAPARNEHLTIVMGVNHHRYDPREHHILSNASCTTNGLAPMAHVLHRAFGIQRGFMTTVHAYTNSQGLQDGIRPDLREGRAGAENLVPTTTGAARAIGRVLPELNGRLDGMSIRVPVPSVSIVDLVATYDKPVTAADLNAVLAEAAEGELKGILGFNTEPLVSADLRGDPRSSIIDAPLTMASGHMGKTHAWYDNEWGYSCRLGDLAAFVLEKGW
jgi:glyceraldehyde 3-phosphate dehydrogenase